MITAETLVEVPDVEPGIALAVAAQEALDLSLGRLVARGQLAPVVEPPGMVGLVPGPPAPETSAGGCPG